MQFSSHTSDFDLVSHTEFLLGGGVTISATGSYTLKDFTRNANERMRQIWSFIFQSKSGWKWDDSNQTDLPQAYTDLVASQTKYALPESALTVERIEIADSAGNYSVVKFLTQEEVDQAFPDFFDEAGIPIYARLLNGTIELYPAPNYNYTAGLRVYFTRDIVEFATTDTTKTPGFASPFHQLVAIGAALDFAQARGMNDKVTLLTGMWANQVAQLQYYYSNRFPGNKPLQLKTKFRSAR